MKILLLKTAYNILGSISIGNGLWMLFFASNWYQYMPAGIEDTGPLNTHFVHDIGFVYFLAGVAAIWCGFNLGNNIKIHTGLTLFVVGHALIHVVEIFLGLLPKSHWLIDFPLIFLPAILLLTISPFVLNINLNAR